ncbi:hypothetical protein BH24ACT3_BH24ACT3_07320 [soil metagenome]
MLDDGTYDALVVDADGESLDLVVLGGAHKGEVVTLRASRLGRDPLDLLGVPATLVVNDGAPTVHLEG